MPKDNSHYEKDGVTYPRVTSIIAQVAKPALIPWAAKCAAKSMYEIMMTGVREDPNAMISRAADAWKKESDAAKEIGSIVHAKINDYFMLGTPVSEMVLSVDAQEIRKATMAFISWAKDCNARFLASEAQIFCDQKMRYAGTVDFIGNVDTAKKTGDLVVIDFKTDKRVYPATAMQIAAYWHGLKNPKLKKGMCVRLDKETGEYEVKEYSLSTLKKEYAKFSDLLRLWYHTKKIELG